MKIAPLVLMLALAPVVSAQSHDMPHSHPRSDKSGMQVCVGSQFSKGKRRPALRSTAGTGAFPCPEYLETTVYGPKRRLIST